MLVVRTSIHLFLSPPPSFLPSLVCKVVETLLANGADVDLHYPIWIASKNGFTDVVKLLIEAGADVNQETESAGASPLRAAALRGWTDVCQLLVDAGAKITDSLTNIDGDIDVVADEKGYEDIAELILSSQS